MEERISIKENERYKILEYYNRPHKNKIFNCQLSIFHSFSIPSNSIITFVSLKQKA